MRHPGSVVHRSALREYWGQERAYHHTAPINARAKFDCRVVLLMTSR